MALSSTRQHFSLISSFFHAQSDSSQFSWEWNFFKIPKAYFNSYNGHLRKFKFQLLGVIQGAHHTPEVGCFFKMFKIQLFCCFITQLVKKLQQWSLYQVIEDILLFVLNTKRPLSDIWLLRYKQNSFGCFRRNSGFQFF